MAEAQGRIATIVLDVQNYLNGKHQLLISDELLVAAFHAIPRGEGAKSR